jgi:hypothetical protein
VLLPGDRPENLQLDKGERWKLLTVRNWDESHIGEWTLSIVDMKEGDAGCVSAAYSISYGPNTLGCDTLENMKLCADGAIDPFGVLTSDQLAYVSGFEDNGRTAAEACCACGGAGLNCDEIVDQL